MSSHALPNLWGRFRVKVLFTKPSLLKFLSFCLEAGSLEGGNFEGEIFEGDSFEGGSFLTGVAS